MAIREKVFDTIVGCFKRHGAVTIESLLLLEFTTKLHIIKYRVKVDAHTLIRFMTTITIVVNS